MNKDDLLKLKEHIKTFTREEQKLRDEYLRRIANGELQGPMVGYPSIDQPSLKHYDMEKYHADRQGENITYALLRQNADNLDGIALEYFYNKITYKEFFERIADLMKALKANGIGEGDVVTVCMPGIPEAMTCVYGIGGLGATGLYIAPYLDIKTMKSDISKDSSRILIIMDAFYEKFKDVFDEVIKTTSIEKVVYVPTLNSSPLRRIQKASKTPEGFISYNDFIKEGEGLDIPKIAPYKKDMPVAVVYSSGTTGVLKGITLSHDTFNNSAESYRAFGFDLSRGQLVYQAIPTWASTGLIADGTTALYYGCTLYQDPRFDPLIYSKNLGLHKINWGVATTELFAGLDEVRKQKLFKFKLKTNILDYRDLRNIYIGGTLSTEKNKQRLNEILKSVGCKEKAKRSYGNCENGSIVTAELNGIDHPANSVGYPIPGVIVMAVDEEGNELPYGERGELVVKTNCGMLDYYNRPDLSDKVFFDETKEFKHTGDIGYVMATGDVIYEGRGSDYSVVDGAKFYNFDIKNAILEHPYVYDAEVFINPNGDLCAHVQFYEGVNMNKDVELKLIQAMIHNRLKDIRAVPEYFKIRESFPMASSTKRDFVKIKSENDGFVYISNKDLIKTYTKH